MRAAGHFEHQRDVAVGEGDDREFGFQAGESFDRVGPGVEPAPGVAPVVEQGGVERGGVDAVVGEEIDQHLAVEDVEDDERAAAFADGGHRGEVARAPAVGESVRVEVGAGDCGEERRGFAGDAGAPVDHGAEDVEGEGGVGSRP